MTIIAIVWAGIGGIAGFYAALRWTQHGSRRRDRLKAAVWREALELLAQGDAGGARQRAQHIEEVGGGGEVGALYHAAAALEDEQRARRDAERARHDLEDSLAALPDGVLVVDSDARLRFLNGAAAAMFGARVEDTLGAGLLEALPSFELEQAVRSTLMQGQSVVREMALYMSPDEIKPDDPFSNGIAYDDGRREVLLRVSPVRRLGRASGAIAILHDLTELRRLERVRRDFVANASHELRTPVANIRAAAETVLSDPDDAALRARFLPHLVIEAERLSRLVTDLLDLARADAQGEDLALRSRVDLQTIVGGVLERLRAKAEAGGVTLHWERGEAACVLGDAAGLEQVAFNLIENALSYTPSGGNVTARVERRAASYDEAAPEYHEVEAEVPAEVALIVSDTGIGIPPEDVARIFERFYRVDKARSRAQGGTGLGLAIVKHIVENHGGHVAVESEVGKGTTFTVLLPEAA